MKWCDDEPNDDVVVYICLSVNQRSFSTDRFGELQKLGKKIYREMKTNKSAELGQIKGKTEASIIYLINKKNKRIKKNSLQPVDWIGLDEFHVHGTNVYT